jgi:hypothetical protein
MFLKQWFATYSKGRSGVLKNYFKYTRSCANTQFRQVSDSVAFNRAAFGEGSSSQLIISPFSRDWTGTL